MPLLAWTAHPAGCTLCMTSLLLPAGPAWQDTLSAAIAAAEAASAQASAGLAEAGAAPGTGGEGGGQQGSGRRGSSGVWSPQGAYEMQGDGSTGSTCSEGSGRGGFSWGRGGFSVWEEEEMGVERRERGGNALESQKEETPAAAPGTGAAGRVEPNSTDMAAAAAACAAVADGNAAPGTAPSTYGEPPVATAAGTAASSSVSSPSITSSSCATARAEFRWEVMAMVSCGQRCPQLLRFYGVCVDVRRRMCIVTKLMLGGTLHDLLRRRNGVGLPLPLLLRVAMDIALGMRFLHRHGIIHRPTTNPAIFHSPFSSDLKTANVLLDEQGRAVVGDFGVVRLVGDGAEMTNFGIVLWELLTVRLPYESYSPLQAAVAMALNGLRPAIPAGCPEGLRRLIETCWARDPAERPDSEDVVRVVRGLSDLSFLRALEFPAWVTRLYNLQCLNVNGDEPRQQGLLSDDISHLTALTSL
ncbi:unnamed protein product [Closterium sp. NIES-64]|nr:unnamed protein product [Closterium sp. NIES-64]